MNVFSAWYHQRLACVDLASGQTEAMPLRRDALEEGVGGVALGSVLSRRWPDALILAACPYTGGFAPASGHLAATFPQEDGTAPAVLALGRGAWLRRSGFDALVIRGQSASPCLLRCRGGQCSLEKLPSSEPGRGRNRLRAALLRSTADGLAGLILADREAASENADAPSAAGAEYGPLPGGSVLGPALQRKKVLALILEGGNTLPPMPIPAENPLRRAVPAQRGQLEGLRMEIVLAAEKNLPPSPASGANDGTGSARVHALIEFLPSGARHAACSHCPSPCLAWIPAPGGGHLLAADHDGLLAALQSFGRECAAYLSLCDARGLDPVGSQPVFAGKSPAGATASGRQAARGLSALTEEMRIGLTLGICPRLIRRVSAPDMGAAAYLGGDMATRVAQASDLVPREVYL
ncbi:MAG: hypothetical protein LBB60_05925 [Desulfovibrio sp.]|jgi:hypothetical protein|nr:hypothetical protein [Desulfovibrio sp.]